VRNVSDLLIRAVDPHDDADMDGFQDVYAAAERAEDPGVGLYSREDAVAMLTVDSSQLFDGFGAFVDGVMVGESVLMGSTRDNLELGQVLLAGSCASRPGSATASRATGTSRSDTATPSR